MPKKPKKTTWRYTGGGKQPDIPDRSGCLRGYRGAFVDLPGSVRGVQSAAGPQQQVQGSHPVSAAEYGHR